MAHRHARVRNPENRRTRPRVRSPKRLPRDAYDTNSFRRAIERACKAAKTDAWAPNQLRHAAATRIRREEGLEAARVVLGHTSAETTEIYAERDQLRAIEVMAKLG